MDAGVQDPDAYLPSKSSSDNGNKRRLRSPEILKSRVAPAVAFTPQRKRKTKLVGVNGPASEDDSDVSIEGELRPTKVAKRNTVDREYGGASRNLYAEPKRALTLGKRGPTKASTFEAALAAAEQLAPVADDIAATDSSLMQNAEWLAEQQKAGVADYFALSQPARRKLVVEYYRRHASARNPRLKTINYFCKQRGWPKAPVYKMIRAFVDRGQTESKKPPGTQTKFDLEAIQAKYREKLAASDGDISKVSMRQFCIENGLTSSGGRRLVLKDKHLDEQSKKRNYDAELRFEAIRSLIISKFIEFTGDYHERRNACVRYFWKTPGFNQMTVRAAVNKFVRSGSVRSHLKNQRTNWNSEEMRSRSLVMSLKPEEAEFMQVLNNLQTEIGHTCSVPKDARVGQAENSSGDRISGPEIIRPRNRTRAPQTTSADADSPYAVQLHAALAELQSTREALAAAQRQIQVLQASATTNRVQPEDQSNANSFTFNGDLRS